MLSPVVLAAVVAILLLYLVARRHAPAPAPAPADTAEVALDWVTAPDHRPLAAGGARPAGAWHVVAVPDLAAAEDLLDALEAAGYEEAELLLFGRSTYRVRWR